MTAAAAAASLALLAACTHPVPNQNYGITMVIASDAGVITVEYGPDGGITRSEFMPRRGP